MSPIAKRVVNETRDKILVKDLKFAKTYWQRLVGLMGRAKLGEGCGLWIVGSGNSIHSFFMRFAIDLIFVTKDKKVKFLVKQMKPWKVTFVPTLERTDCLELPAGTIEKSGTCLGDTLRVEA